LTRFSEELADIDTLFQNATSVLEDVWDEESAEEDDNLAGLELAEDQETHGTAMDLDGDDMHIGPLAHLVENGYWYCA
jgi:hypothetical protein